ncbi:ABC transporter ATP-binding protein [Bacillus alkalicellulosilyticus]|uniref:ABC transporter ATP-binding protein n=1 Tax=Alkalihalobacterium alkalicellulosilyticum TaxID=1912214 RepID=UPI0009973CA7|nr:ABC transporter ATP-binding protein [Bacillus alkalicellulosilyticus]
MSVLLVDNLTKQYTKKIQALDKISFQVDKGECIGIVGESGSGKSTLARIILGLEKYKEGQVLVNEKPIAPRKRALLRQYRKEVQMIFQDSTSTLNPKLPIWKSILEPLDNFKEIYPSLLPSKGLLKKEIAEALLEMVGLEKEMATRYPGELSGGQKQRVSIARALSIEPSLLVCDEPTASLDVTVQVQILQLLKKLQEQINMTILFISHDIRAVTFLCEKIIVLQHGSIVDEFKVEEIYDPQRHPYTKALIQAASFE